MPTRARRSKPPVIPHREGITLPPGRSAGGGLDQRGGYRLPPFRSPTARSGCPATPATAFRKSPPIRWRGEIIVTACSLVPSPLGRDAAGAIDQAVPLQRSSSARNGAQQFGCACRANPAAQACPPPGRAPSGAGVRRGPQRPHPNPCVAAASSTVRSISRRSRSRSISQARNQTKVPSETAAPPRPSSPAPAASAGRRTSRAGSRLSERQRARPGGNACPAYSLAALPAMVRVLAGAWVISIRRACAAGAAGMVTRRTPSA